MELVGYEDVEARSHEALALLVVHEHMDGETCQISAMEMRTKTLMEVKL